MLRVMLVKNSRPVMEKCSCNFGAFFNAVVLCFLFGFCSIFGNDEKLGRIYSLARGMRTFVK